MAGVALVVKLCPRGDVATIVLPAAVKVHASLAGISATTRLSWPSSCAGVVVASTTAAVSTLMPMRTMGSARDGVVGVVDPGSPTRQPAPSRVTRCTKTHCETRYRNIVTVLEMFLRNRRSLKVGPSR